MRDLVLLAGMQNELDSATGVRTILAPSDQAFETYETTHDLDDPAVVRELLRHHIALGSLTTSNIFAVSQLQMEDGEFLDIDGPSETIEPGTLDAKVIVEDIESSNGYLHVVDKVLPPA